MNIRPLHDRVIVRRTEEEKTTASGLIILIQPLKSHQKVKSLLLVMAELTTTVIPLL